MDSTSPPKTTAVDDARKPIPQRWLRTYEHPQRANNRMVLVTIQELIEQLGLAEAQLRQEREAVQGNWFPESFVVQLQDQIARLQTTVGQQENREHVAWCRFKKRGGSDQSYLVLCDSDAPGAFKVYR